jgi:hypothetical protein
MTMVMMTTKMLVSKAGAAGGGGGEGKRKRKRKGRARRLDGTSRCMV